MEKLKVDQDYFAAYFKICELYQQKRGVIKQLRSPENELSEGQVKMLAPSVRKVLNVTTPKKKICPKVLQERIVLLNKRIIKEESLFWAAVDKAQKEGFKFAFESMSEQFKLQPFEKRILLYFFYLEYCDIKNNVCLEDELLKLFDLEDSVFLRMMNHKYFTSDAALFSSGFLITEGHKLSGSAYMDVLLTNQGLTLLSSTLSNEKVEEKKVHTWSDSETVGYVKEPEYTLDDVLLKDETKEKVKLFLDAFRDNKFETLGVKERIKKGLGTVFLFYGPPGTGKSMLAEAIGKYVNKKILMVEYPKIMERWVGATDKNISRIFTVAEKEDLVILLDEADTLFYNRALAFQEHDIRFVNEMLQELERFKGMIILTSNMAELLDQALERRVSLKVKFEKPTQEARLGIWRSHISSKVKVSQDVDFKHLSEKYDFAGGNIKNAVLNAFRKMASRSGETLLMQDLIFGADMEKEGMFSVKSNPIGFLA